MLEIPIVAVVPIVAVGRDSGQAEHPQGARQDCRGDSRALHYKSSLLGTRLIEHRSSKINGLAATCSGFLARPARPTRTSRPRASAEGISLPITTLKS